MMMEELKQEEGEPEPPSSRKGHGRRLGVVDAYGKEDKRTTRLSIVLESVLVNDVKTCLMFFSS
jgi:hypothetical protein